MRKRRAAKTAVNVELFPFLAVLMCTMGSLLLLLVILARQARERAVAEAAEKAAVAEPVVSHQAEERAELEARYAAHLEELKVSRDEAERQRRLLDELEQQVAALRERLAQLEAAASAPRDPAETDLDLAAELARLKRSIADKTEELAKARVSAYQAKSSYAVIPYVGKNGTYRRPIYIECRADRIVLQPSGMEFKETDFPESLPSYNPLSAAALTAVEYYRRSSARDPEAGQPYPLLLVRPDGISAYYAARAALKSLGDDFGYELIEADWNLTFGENDERLAELMLLAAQDARNKQRLLAIAAPDRYAPRRSTGFRVGANGGLVRDDDGRRVDGVAARRSMAGTSRAGGNGSADGDLADRYDSPVAGAGRGSPRGTGGGSGAGTGDGFGAKGDVFGDKGSEPGGALAQNAASMRSPGSGNLGDAASPGNANTGNFSRGDALAGAADNNNGRLGNATSGSGNATSGSGQAASGSGQATSGANSGESGPGGTPTTGTTAGSSARFGDPNAAQGEGTSPATLTEQWAAKNARPGQRPAAGQAGETPRLGEYQERPPEDLPPLAKNRGENWALRDQWRGAIALTRPIRVICDGQYLQVVPERQTDRTARKIEIDGRTEEAVGQLVDQVQGLTADWGIAGNGMYWRPVLQVEVTATGRQRYQEMSSLLEGSGLVVREKPAAAARPARRGR